MRAFFGRFVLALVIAAVITTVSVASALWYAEDKVAEIDIIPGADAALDPEPSEPGSPANFLVVGSDTRAFVETDTQAEFFGTSDEVSGQRSDTIMIVQVDPEAGTGMVLSFPRDLWVDIPGRGEAKLNAAFNDGIDVLIETIRTNFDIPVHHALQLDFAGFEGIVDALGTVGIYFPTPARDTQTGLLSPLGGCQELHGDQALAYVRSRQYEYWVVTGAGEGYWQTDPRADIGRIARQQYFMRTIAAEAIASSRNPFTAKVLLDRAVSNLSRSESLGFDEIQRLVATFRDLDPSVVPMETVPFTSGRAGGGQSVLFADREPLEPLLERLRRLSPTSGLVAPEVAPGDVSVRISTSAGDPGTVVEQFRVAGFVAEPGGSAGAVAISEVRYAAGAEDEAFLVLLSLGGRGQLVETDAVGTDVHLIIGEDFVAVDPVGVVESSPAPTEAPELAGDQSPAPTSTTTTVPFVLGDPVEGLPAAQNANAALPLVGCPPGL